MNETKGIQTCHGGELPGSNFKGVFEAAKKVKIPVHGSVFMSDKRPKESGKRLALREAFVRMQLREIGE